jgi:uncharacterized membrane protein
MTFRKLADLLVIAIITMIAASILEAGVAGCIRVLIVLPVVFIFPGYTLIAAIFSDANFPIETHIVFAIALSIAVTILTGLVLHFTAWGLEPRSWLLALTEIILVAGTIAVFRRLRSPTFTGRDFQPDVNILQASAFGLAIVLAFVAVGIARNGVLNQPQAGFTQLWILPPASNSPDAVRLGIQNEEATPVTYHLILLDGITVLGEWNSIQLAPGEQWQDQVTIDSTTRQSGNKLDARLYRSESPNIVYRSTSFALNSPSPSS